MIMILNLPNTWGPNPLVDSSDHHIVLLISYKNKPFDYVTYQGELLDYVIKLCFPLPPSPSP